MLSALVETRLPMKPRCDVATEGAPGGALEGFIVVCCKDGSCSALGERIEQHWGSQLVLLLSPTAILRL